METRKKTKKVRKSGKPLTAREPQSYSYIPPQTNQDEKENKIALSSSAKILAAADSHRADWPALQRPQTKYRDKANREFERAVFAATFGMLPMVAIAGYQMTKSQGEHSTIARAVGSGVLTVGLMAYPVQLLVMPIVAIEEALRGSVNKILSLIVEGDPKQQQINAIYESFQARMLQVIRLLVTLDPKEEKPILENIKNGKCEDLIGLALLCSAYHSRKSSISLELANGKSLYLHECPDEEKYINLFCKVNGLGQLIKNALPDSNSDGDKNLQDADIVIPWITSIRAGKKLPVEKDGTPKEHQVINEVLGYIEDLKKLALKVLPETPEQLAEKLGKMAMK